MNKIINSFNEIFSNIPKWTSNNRKSKISTIDAVKYRFKYSKIDTTKEQVKGCINTDSKLCAHRTSYDRKENNIDNSFYIKLLNNIRNFYNSNYNNNNKLSIISVDGTFNNTNIKKFSDTLETSLNMGYYDTINDVPIDLTFSGPNKKNTELEQLKKYIDDNNLTNIIIVADRAYFKYDFFQYLKSKNIFFVIRIKSNSHLLTNVKNNNKQKDLINDLKNTSRIIKYKSDNIKTLISKKGDIIKVKENNEYYLITNLIDNKEYSDEIIKEIYNSRWKVETYFKLIKNNFKFSYLTEKKEEQYNKLITIQLIITYICKILKHYYLQNNKAVKGVNESNIIRGIYDKLLDTLINAKLTDAILSSFITNYVIAVNNKPNRKFPRSCKSPFKKWYIKMYSDISKYARIQKYIEDPDNNKLDKNLKLKIKSIEITITKKISK